MGHDDEQITDLVPPAPLVINIAAGVDAAAGVLLLLNSDLIHHVIGVVLILFSIYLFLYARRVGAALERTRRRLANEAPAAAAKPGSDDPGGSG